LLPVELLLGPKAFVKRPSSWLLGFIWFLAPKYDVFEMASGEYCKRKLTSDGGVSEVSASGKVGGELCFLV